MTRFKKEIRKKGIMLECDYECLPCNGIDTVIADSETATVKMFDYRVGWIHFAMSRTGEVQEVCA